MPDMNISRRKFIGGAVGFAAFGFGRALGVKPFTHSSGECFLRGLELYRGPIGSSVAGGEFWYNTPL